MILVISYQGFTVTKGVGVIIAEKVNLVIMAIHCNGMNSQRVLVVDSVVDTPEGHISRKCTQP